MADFKILEGGLKEGAKEAHIPQSRSQLENAARKVGQTGASVVSTRLGLAGDIAGGALGLANYATGGATPTYGQIQEKLPVSLPTSEQVRGGINRATGGFTEAKTPGEQTWDDIVSTATNLLIPFPTPGKLRAAGQAVKGLSKAGAALKAGKALAVAGVGQGAKETAKTFGFGEGVQEVAKVGSMILASMFGGRYALRGNMKEGYKFAEDAGANGTVPSSTILPIVEKIESKLPADYPAKQFIDERIKAIKGIAQKESPILDASGRKIVRTEVPVPEIVSLKQGLNEYFTDKSIPHKADKKLGRLLESLKKPLDEYGKENKEFGKYWNYSEDVFTGLKNASKATEFLRRNVNVSNLKNAGVQAVMAALGGYFGHIPGVVAPLGITFGAKHASQFWDFILKSKEARKYYTDMLKSAAKGSAASASRNLNNLDKIAQRDNFSFEPEGFKIISGGKVK